MKLLRIPNVTEGNLVKWISLINNDITFPFFVNILFHGAG